MTCPITLYEAVPVGIDETLRAMPYPCGRPVERMGLCDKHAEDHERLCDGSCNRCQRGADV